MLILVRHGQTQWSLTGQHTGLTDISLTKDGIESAKKLKPYLGQFSFDLILSSPLSRAKDTAKYAGFDNIQIDDDLLEWNYGDTEGLTSLQMDELKPGWNLFKDGVTNGEEIQQVYERALRVVDKVEPYFDKNVLIFAHGHILRVLACAWIGQDPHFGSKLVLDPCSVSYLGYEHDSRAIIRWNFTEY